MLQRFKQFAAEQKNGFCMYEWSSGVIKRGSQVFAIFGSMAYDVSKLHFNYDETCVKGTGRLCVSIKGRYLAQFPDEGQSGIMGMYIINRGGVNRKSEPTFVVCGWLHTHELKLSNAEIEQNIIEDVECGKNVFTNAPAGWVF